MQKLSINAPDDFHLHLRDGPVLQAVAPLSAAAFDRAIIMPNLQPPVRNLADATAYRARILKSLPPSSTPFTPLMTLYLTDTTSPADIRSAAASGFVPAAKLYPAGATTNSALGVTSIAAIAPALSAMEEAAMVLCVHGEVTRDAASGEEVDMFDREAAFLQDVLPTLLSSYPRLRIVLEHVTTSDAAAIVQSTPGNRLAATVTAHHLLYSRQALFAGAKIRPHMFCLPVLKRERHRRALLEALATDDRGLFFAGTDSAPHRMTSKHCSAGCAGVFTAVCAVQLYAEAFEEARALEKLDAFLSFNGAKFYGLERNTRKVRLEKVPAENTSATIPESIAVRGESGEDDGDPIIPLRAGEKLAWQIVD